MKNAAVRLDLHWRGRNRVITVCGLPTNHHKGCIIGSYSRPRSLNYTHRTFSRPSTNLQAFEREVIEQRLESIEKVESDNLGVPLDVDEYGEHGAAFLSGNYVPITREITAEFKKSALDATGRNLDLVVLGAIPDDFPLGQYSYVGPNPKFPVDHYKRWGLGPQQETLGFGESWHHWFEGDGMIYAIDFGAGKNIKYRNRFIRTKSWERELSHGARIFRPLMNAEGSTFLLNALSNLLHGGSFMKDSANTALVHFAGRTFALQDTCPPWEIDPETLHTVAPCTFDGKLPFYVPFTAHPKVIPSTGELVFFGFNPVFPPHCTVGSLNPEGQVTRINPLWSLPFVGSVFMHDFCVTEHFTVLFEGSMDIKPLRQLFGEHPLQYNFQKAARFGVINRSSNSTNVTWFNCSSAQMVYHFINSWEEINEENEQLLVITGVREDGFFQEAMRPSGSRQWVENAVHVEKNTPRVHEWRINLVTGAVNERYLFTTSVETPRINDAFVGQRNRYAYSGRIDLGTMETAAQLKFDAIVKFDFENNTSCVYEHGPNRYGMEAQFVPRLNSTYEDDGWLIMYVHDETHMTADHHGSTECIILDARNIESGPIARIMLPERVPYGAHCMWRADLTYPYETFSTDINKPVVLQNPDSQPRIFTFKREQTTELLEAVQIGIMRVAMGLFVNGWSPGIKVEEKSEYAFVRGGGLRFSESHDLGGIRSAEARSESLSGKPSMPTIVLYDIENDCLCRSVREVLSVLDIAYTCKPCPHGSNVHRSELAQIQGVEFGEESLPALQDVRTGIVLSETENIIRYLYDQYMDKQAPPMLTLAFMNVSMQTSKLHSCSACSSTLPEQPLTLWAYEPSPFCALVRRTLCELELPYILLPCARGSPRRNLLFNSVGLFQVPYLEDPNTGVSMFESSDIVTYLRATYMP